MLDRFYFDIGSKTFSLKSSEMPGELPRDYEILMDISNDLSSSSDLFEEDEDTAVPIIKSNLDFFNKKVDIFNKYTYKLIDINPYMGFSLWWNFKRTQWNGIKNDRLVPVKLKDYLKYSIKECDVQVQIDEVFRWDEDKEESYYTYIKELKNLINKKLQ